MRTHQHVYRGRGERSRVAAWGRGRGAGGRGRGRRGKLWSLAPGGKGRGEKSEVGKGGKASDLCPLGKRSGVRRQRSGKAGKPLISDLRSLPSVLCPLLSALCRILSPCKSTLQRSSSCISALTKSRCASSRCR